MPRRQTLHGLGQGCNRMVCDKQERAVYGAGRQLGAASCPALLAPWRDQLFDPARLFIRQLLQPGRDGAASQVASDPRPPPDLILRGPDGERDDLEARVGAGASHYSAPRRRMDSTSPKGPKWREKSPSEQPSAASRLARTGAVGSRWPRSTAERAVLGMPARRATCRCAWPR